MTKTQSNNNSKVPISFSYGINKLEDGTLTLAVKDILTALEEYPYPIIIDSLQSIIQASHENGSVVESTAESECNLPLEGLITESSKEDKGCLSIWTTKETDNLLHNKTKLKVNYYNPVAAVLMDLIISAFYQSQFIESAVYTGSIDESMLSNPDKNQEVISKEAVKTSKEKPVIISLNLEAISKLVYPGKYIQATSTSRTRWIQNIKSTAQILAKENERDLILNTRLRGSKLDITLAEPFLRLLTQSIKSKSLRVMYLPSALYVISRGFHKKTETSFLATRFLYSFFLDKYEEVIPTFDNVDYYTIAFKLFYEETGISSYSQWLQSNPKKTEACYWREFLKIFKSYSELISISPISPTKLCIGFKQGAKLIRVGTSS